MYIRVKISENSQDYLVNEKEFQKNNPQLFELRPLFLKRQWQY